MEQFYLENMNIKVTINQKGAEVSRVLSKEKGTEYMWNADSTYWNIWISSSLSRTTSP